MSTARRGRPEGWTPTKRTRRAITRFWDEIGAWAEDAGVRMVNAHGGLPEEAKRLAIPFADELREFARNPERSNDEVEAKRKAQHARAALAIRDAGFCNDRRRR